MTPGLHSPLAPAALFQRFRECGHDTAPDGPGRPVVFGVRARSRVANSFDDCVGVVAPGWGSVQFWTATTDPGLYWLQNPMRAAGTAILCPGQHVQAFALGLHRGAYQCLVQRRPLPVWRDGNRDGTLDTSGPVVTAGIDSGIEIHHAADDHASAAVEKWSAGCSVIASPTDFAAFMKAIGREGPWTYTLLDQWYAP